MLADRVVVVFRVALEADEVGDVVLPHVGIFPIFLGEPPRVVNMPDAGVVGGESEFDDLFGIGYRGKTLAETAQAVHAGADTHVRVFQFVGHDSQRLGRIGHNPHQPLGTGPRNDCRVEFRLLIGDGSKESPVPVEQMGVFTEKFVVRRDVPCRDSRLGGSVFRLLAQFVIAFGDGIERTLAVGVRSPFVDGPCQLGTTLSDDPRGALHEADLQLGVDVPIVGAVEAGDIFVADRIGDFAFGNHHDEVLAGDGIALDIVDAESPAEFLVEVFQTAAVAGMLLDVNIFANHLGYIGQQGIFLVGSLDEDLATLFLLPAV